MALAPLLYNITFDSQTRILYFWDKAGHEIYHCEIPSPAPSIPFGGVLTSTSDSVIRVPVEQAGGVVEEYSPAPALPAVSLSGDFGEDNWLYAWSSSDTPMVWPISVNDVTGLYEYNSGAYDTAVVYDSSKSYAVIEWYSNTYLTDKGVNGVLVAVENNNYLNAKNIGSEGVMFHASRIAVCSSSSATVITVYDSSNNPYNAFKYTSDGTDYYYVLDGTQTDWTDDLASIGYKLPTIGYVSSIKTEISMNAGDLHTLYDEIGTKMTVSTYGISYPAVRVYSSSSDTTGTAVVNKNWTVHGPQFSSGDLSVSNLTGSTQTIQRIAFIK